MVIVCSAQARQQGFEGLEVADEHRVEGGHGRREVRHVWVLPVRALGGLYQQEEWPGLSPW